MTSPPTTEYLERQHLVLGLADTDAKLQQFTDKQLVPLLRTVVGDSALATKVTEILSFYLRRVRNNDQIKLPYTDLLTIIGEESITARNLTLVCLKVAKNRVSDEDHLASISVLFQAANKLNADKNVVYQIWSFCLPAIVLLSKKDQHQCPKLPELNPLAKKSFLRFLHCVLCFSQDKHHPLSAVETELVEKYVLCDYPTLSNLKLSIIEFLSRNYLNEHVTFPLLVLASGLNLNVLDSAAESALKKRNKDECSNDVEVVKTLMDVFLGSAAEKISPAPLIMQTKILEVLVKSKTASTTYMHCLQTCLAVINIKPIVPKLLSKGLEFLRNVIVEMKPQLRNTFVPAIFSKLRPLSAEIGDETCLARCYGCLEELGKQLPSIVLTNFEFVVELFNSIQGTSDTVAYAIISCLSTWLPIFIKTQDTNVFQQLKTLISEYIQKDDARCRLIALKYVEALLSSDEFDIQWILIKASGDKRDEMKQEAMRLLVLSLKTAVPDIEFATEFIWKEIGSSILKPNGEETAASADTFPAEVVQMSARYLFALCCNAVSEEAELKHVDAEDDHWLVVCPKVANVLKTKSPELVEKLAVICLQAIKQSYDVHLFRVACTLVSIHPIHQMPLAVNACTQRARASTRVELAAASSYLAALLMPDSQKVDGFAGLFTDLTNLAVPGLCWILASFVSVGDLNLLAPNAKLLVPKLLSLAEEGYQVTSSVLEASLGSLGVIFRAYHEGTVDLQLSEAELENIMTVCTKIGASRKDSISAKCRELAVQIVGLLVSQLESPLYEKVIKNLFDIGEGPPRPELQLTVGSALWNVCMGKYSSARRNLFLVAETDMKLSTLSPEVKETCEKRLLALIDNIIQNKLTAMNHHLRRSAIVWLLVLVQKGNLTGADCLHTQLDKVQESFADGLTEDDEFTQDIASKGMAIVYQMATADQKKELVKILMTSLAEGRKAAVKVSGDTVLFKEGQLGKSPDGSNLTTYKEICSLATGLNQPDLIYKFMQLANHNAKWKSKMGAAFGFSAILQEAKEELDPYIGKLVPILYRYRFDPDLKVQASMKSIWTILTQSKRSVIDEYADDIAKNTIPLLTNREYRTRESSCYAMADLLSGHDTPYMHECIPRMMEDVLRVKDDSKESVRIAADRCAKSLRNLIIKLSQSSNEAKSNAFLQNVLPTLIEKGIHSNVAANRGWSLALLIDLSKKAGRQLKPYLHEIIPCLLDSISESESSVLNYIAVRSNTEQLEALDDARAQMARTSPMMTAVYDVIPQIDATVLRQIQPRLCEQLRSSMGVSTRTAASQLLVQLALRAPQLMMECSDMADKFFSALLPGVRDRNPSIRKNFSNALSYLSRFCTPNQMDNLMKVVAKDLTGDSDEMKEASRLVLKNLITNCPELTQGYSTAIVPYVFLETCAEVIKGDEASKKKHDNWMELWNELVPSTDGAVRLYLKEIVALAIDNLKNNAVWTIRAQSAKMLSQTVHSAGSNISLEDADDLVTNILPLLSGRLWDGKVSVLSALGDVIDASGDNRLQTRWSAARQEEVLTVIKREASKKNKEYSAAGLFVTAKFAVRLQNLDAASWLLQRVQLILRKILEPSDDDTSDDELESISNVEVLAIQAKQAGTSLSALVRSLGAYAEGSTSQQALAYVATCFANKSLYWQAKQQAVESLQQVLETWVITKAIDANGLVESLYVLAEDMCVAQRTVIAGQAIQAILKIYERRADMTVDWTKMAQKSGKSEVLNEAGLSSRLENAISD